MTQVAGESPAPAIPARAGSAVADALTVFAWMLAFVGFEWLRYKIAMLNSPVRASDLLNAVSVLEVIEIALIARMSDRSARRSAIGAFEASTMLAGAALFLLVVNQKPLLSALILSSFTLWRFARFPSLRNAAIGQFAFASQFVLLGWPFLIVHNAVGRLDAAVVRAGFRAFGQDASGYGTYLFRPSQHLGFDIMWGCASSTAMVPNAIGFVIITLGLRGRLLRSDVVGLLLILAASLALNWLRLLLICWSRDGYLFWHEGLGVTVFAALYALLVVSVAHAAARGTFTNPHTL